MGATQSSSQAHPPSRALHVLRVTPASPASQTDIEPFFDFVVGFEGDSFAPQKNIDVSQLERIVENHEGRNLNLLVWNSKNQGTRVVSILPSRAWPLSPSEISQQPEHEPRPSLLGLSMRMCQPEFALDHVWHVLDVIEGSPAESAGLVPYGDWIVGWSGGVLSAENDFYELVESHVEKPLRVYVYSYDFDTLREVVLVPNRQWGGEGLLGCVFGFGLLHRIPLDREPKETSAEPQQPYPEYEEQELFAPNSMPGRHRELEESSHEDMDGHQASTARLSTSSHSRTPRESYDMERSRHHHNNNGFDHDRHRPDDRSLLSEISNAQAIPYRTSAWPTNSTSTPPRSHSFGTLMNGSGTTRIISPRASTPVAGLRPPLSLVSGFKDVNDNKAWNEEDDDNDGAMSMIGTGSDTNSLASSLTSVD